jgi:hypothetical protein
MSLLDRLRLRPGQPYDGPAAYVDGNGQGDPRHGFYALQPDGKALRRPLIRLTSVTQPDGSHSYEIARRGDPPHRSEGNVVPLEFAGEGRASLDIGAPDEPEEAPEGVGDLPLPAAAPFADEPEPPPGPPCGFSWAIGEDVLYCQLPAPHEGQEHTAVLNGLMRHPND